MAIIEIAAALSPLNFRRLRVGHLVVRNSAAEGVGEKRIFVVGFN
jgi:hypothetical protein